MAKNQWPQTEATVFTCGWEDTPWYYVGSGNYIITFSYKVDGNHYSGEYDDTVPIDAGSKFILRYNPGNPEENEKTIAMKQGRWLSALAIFAGLAIVAIYLLSQKSNQ